MNRDKLLLRFGIVGTVIVALCCFTPVLVILLGAVGLASLTGYLDIVLLPALAIFVALTIYALYKKKHSPDKNGYNNDTKKG
ncbi:mercury resistance system transport protein MerF [Psychrobacter sp. LV10R520-6]|uniref:mercury resistance system transport protein MerF n=1 Tax=Psychrobacter sp. LV10R520-6 TaxID=1415574 RepID=UPI0024CA9692|nr:mercury resistance system transport protein MerF [Psychrobacter sp. LV10R520-6]SNT69821.1 mercuric ion transport protein [Psychrobacter sp. LV10R520-6]